MSDAMSAEFDTVAEWTADAALALSAEHRVPAGCRGSGGRPALDWLLERLAPGQKDRMIDSGAGIGGPAAYAAETTGIRPVVAEPEAGACRAAQRLFDLPVVRCVASALPFPDDTFEVAWCLGVLCTLQDQLGALTELRRVLTRTGRLGLLVYTIDATSTNPAPEGNNFPTEGALDLLVTDAAFQVESRSYLDDLPDEDPTWSRLAGAVSDRVQQQHGDDEALRTAQGQSETFAKLLETSEVRGTLLVLRPR